MKAKIVQVRKSIGIGADNALIRVIRDSDSEEMIAVAVKS